MYYQMFVTRLMIYNNNNYIIVLLYDYYYYIITMCTVEECGRRESAPGGWPAPDRVVVVAVKIIIL